jgi:hypothetical protein
MPSGWGGMFLVSVTVYVNARDVLRYWGEGLRAPPPFEAPPE